MYPCVCVRACGGGRVEGNSVGDFTCQIDILLDRRGSPGYFSSQTALVLNYIFSIRFRQRGMERACLYTTALSCAYGNGVCVRYCVCTSMPRMRSCICTFSSVCVRFSSIFNQ